MSARIPPEERTAIRAQRNRERSQALRRHQKRRFALLEEASGVLETENCAMRALVFAVVHLRGGDVLRRGLEGYVGGELLEFLGVDGDGVGEV